MGVLGGALSRMNNDCTQSYTRQGYRESSRYFEKRFNDETATDKYLNKVNDTVRQAVGFGEHLIEGFCNMVTKQAGLNLQIWRKVALQRL